MEEVIKRYREEIRQYEIALGGVMEPDYRNHVNEKIADYQLAIIAMMSYLKRKKDY